MNTAELRTYRLIWWASLAVYLLLLVVMFALVEPRFGSDSDKIQWRQVSSWRYLGWGFIALATLSAIAGARVGRSVFVSGSRLKEKLAKLLEDSRKKSPEPSMALFVLAMGLVELPAVLALVVYILIGSFYSYVLLTGMAVLGWLVARPEIPPQAGFGNGDDDLDSEDSDE